MQLTEALGSEYRMSLETLGKNNTQFLSLIFLQRIKNEAHSIHSKVLRTQAISLDSSTDSIISLFKFKTLQHLF